MSNASDVPVLAAEPSAGDMLRCAREVCGLHIGALAVSLKVPVRKLEALEANQFDALPDMVFTRALASSICRTLKIDPAPVLAKLPLAAGVTGTPVLRDAAGLNAPLRSPGFANTGASAQSSGLPKPLLFAVFALLAGALLLYFLPKLEQLARTYFPDSLAMATIDSVAPATPLVSAPVASSTPATLSAVVSPVVVLPVVSPSVASVAVAPQEPASGLVVFSVKTDTWVEVVDARGASSLRRLIPAGQSAAANGNPPLTVTVGRADTTEVKVRGQPFDLKSVSRDNVARFQVN
jgi:cytoskeleton protein RodZ